MGEESEGGGGAFYVSLAAADECAGGEAVRRRWSKTLPVRALDGASRPRSTQQPLQR